MKTKVAKNYIYNVIYQMLTLIIPLITAPYLSRVLGAKGIGIYSYNYSIAYYFGLFIMLGVNNYGNRMIAKCLVDKEKINKTFSEVYFLQFILGIVFLIIYLLYSFFLCQEKIVVLCYIPFVISYALDVNWFYFGQEKFKIILLRNVVVKLLTTIMIFCLVKKTSDVMIYILIMSFGALLSQVLIWVLIFKDFKLKKVNLNNLCFHFKNNVILFIPVIAVSVYRIMDKIMLGSLSNMIQVGYYESAEKIISILLSFITALGTVMLPRMSVLFEKNDKKQINKMINNSFIFISIITSIISFGIASISSDFVYLFYGSNYMPCALVLQLLCITVPFISYANIVRMQILIPQCKDKAYVISCFVGAVTNLIFNLFFIPKFQSVGAAIGTIVSEIVVMVIQTFNARNDIHIKEDIKVIVTIWLSGLTMFGFLNILGQLNDIVFINLLLRIGIGAISYFVVLLFLSRVLNIDYFKNIISNLFNNKLRRREKNG